MRPLTLDDLLPLEEYAARRRELFESQGRYVDRYRRVRVGPQLTLLFENRQTLWFRVHEILRIARLSEPTRLQQELDVYNQLLPQRDQLQAALVIAAVEDGRPVGNGEPWQALRGEHLFFELGDKRVVSRLVTCRPEDRAFGAAHWLEFTIGPDERKLLADFRIAVRLVSGHPCYLHRTPLSEETRRSLLDDLELSDRDPVTAARAG